MVYIKNEMDILIEETLRVISDGINYVGERRNLGARNLILGVPHGILFPVYHGNGPGMAKCGLMVFVGGEFVAIDAGDLVAGVIPYSDPDFFEKAVKLIKELP